MAKILLLDSPGVREARLHPALVGKKLLGSGLFSGVYEGSRPDTVLKLSVDHSWHELFTRWKPERMAHFPVVIKNYGCVGKTVIGTNLRTPKPKTVPLFLVEIERLEKVPLKTANHKLARHIAALARSAHYSPSLQGLHGHTRTAEVINELSNDETIPPSMREGLNYLGVFCANYQDAFLDLHVGNFMQRPQTGDLVLSDPIACYSAFNHHT